MCNYIEHNQSLDESEKELYKQNWLNFPKNVNNDVIHLEKPMIGSHWEYYGNDNDLFKEIELKAAQTTGVYGWKIVRFVNKNHGKWHPTTDNALGTQVPYGNSYDYTNNWSVLFEESVPNFDEYCFSTYDFSKWLTCTKDTVTGTYNNSDANIIYLLHTF